MVESWMDRVARAAPSQQDAGGSEPSVHADQDNPGWDPYEVWYRQVKQVRDRSPEQYSPAVAQKPASEPAPRRRLRIAGLLPRLSG
ncbi:MAG TPA: hypothetical protein VLT59_06030 [Steroidobacteraceae bacterium]|nr:hypothetical protein [Steroidobacteraceae bacterium]